MTSHIIYKMETDRRNGAPIVQLQCPRCRSLTEWLTINEQIVECRCEGLPPKE